MKRGKRWLIALLCLAVIAGGILAASAMAGRRPYKDLTAADIQSATVLLTPPDITLEIPDTGELAEYLSQVVIYGTILIRSTPVRGPFLPSIWPTAAPPISWHTTPSW